MRTPRLSDNEINALIDKAWTDAKRRRFDEVTRRVKAERAERKAEKRRRRFEEMSARLAEKIRRNIREGIITV